MDTSEISPELFHQCFDLATDAMLLIESGNVLYHNSAAAKLLGHCRENSQCAEKSILRGLPLSEVSSTLAQLSLQQTPAKFELELHKQDTSSVHVECTSASLNADGRQLLHLTLRDISAAKRESRAHHDNRSALEYEIRQRTHQLIQSEQRLAVHLENTPLGVISWNEQFKCTLWNPAAERIFGFSKDEAIGTNALKLLVPEELHAHINDIFVELMNQTGGEHSVNKNLTKDGREILCEWFNTALIDVDGNTIGIASIVQDISERDRDHRYLLTLRGAFDAMPVPVAVFDQNDRYVFTNRAYLELNDPADPSTQIGHSFEEHLRALVQRGQVPSAAGREQQWVADQLRPTHSGARTFEVEQTPGTWHLGIAETLETGGRVFMLTDISDLKHSQQQMILAKEQAEAANRAKSSFLANMSHEIRTPMNGVVGIAELLAESDLSDERKQMLRTMLNSSRSLLRIIDDILDLSKIDAGKLNLEHIETSIREISESAALMMAPAADDANVRLHLQITAEVPELIRSDPNRIRQIIVNLLSNAVKFSARDALSTKGQVTLRLSCCQADELQAGKLRIEVIDDGIGMDQATIATLFTPFTQADEATTRRFGGSGLGLSIVANLVQLLNGKITVDSKPQCGTKLTVELPFELIAAFDHSVLSDTIAGFGWFGLFDAEFNASVVEENQRLTKSSAMRYARDEDHLVELISTHLGASIVVLAAGSMEENNRIMKRLRLYREDARFLCQTADRSARLGQVKKNCYVISRFPTLPSEILEGLASLAQDLEPARPNQLNAINAATSWPALETLARVLLVEDNAINQEVISLQLEHLGYAVDIAENGLEALSRCSSVCFDAILVDCHMPVMDGFEMTARLRSIEQANRRKRTPIIAITANALKGESSRCLAAGMDDFLPKPVALSKLKNTLERWL